MSKLFGPHDTLILYSFMYGPERELPCPGCTHLLDGIDGAASRRLTSSASAPTARSLFVAIGPFFYDRQRLARGCRLLICCNICVRSDLYFRSNAMSSLTMTIAGLDKEILLTLNSFGGGIKNLWELANNSLFRGFPLFFSLAALWFSGDHRERRGRMLAGLLAVCLGTILSVWLQFHIAVHTRPILDPALHLENVIPLGTWDRASSFPSDTATLYFGLAAVVFVEERLVGLFCFVWVAVIISIPRVIFGFHYASDIIGSLVLGSAGVFIFAKSPYPRRLFERTLMLFKGRMYIVHALLFVFLAEASNVFVSLQALGKELVRLLGSPI
jgi:undecaprenyl-diphosphatase